MANGGRVLSKAQILDHVWQYDFDGDGASSSRTSPTCARRSTASSRPLIHTLRGVGYGLRVPEDVARVALVAADPLVVGITLLAMVGLIAVNIVVWCCFAPICPRRRRPAAHRSARSAARRRGSSPVRPAGRRRSGDDDNRPNLPSQFVFEQLSATAGRDQPEHRSLAAGSKGPDVTGLTAAVARSHGAAIFTLPRRTAAPTTAPGPSTTAPAARSSSRSRCRRSTRPCAAWPASTAAVSLVAVLLLAVLARVVVRLGLRPLVARRGHRRGDRRRRPVPAGARRPTGHRGRPAVDLAQHDARPDRDVVRRARRAPSGACAASSPTPATSCVPR